MQVRNSHLGDGPRLQASSPDPMRQEKLSIYAANLYAKLIEYARAHYAPTQDGAYRDLFASHHPDTGSSARTTNTYLAGSQTPEQIANTLFNLVGKINEHNGALFLVVAPTATNQERNTLRQALTDLHPEWQHLHGLDTPASKAPVPPAAIVYHWLNQEEPNADLWPPDTYKPQQETDIFRSPPQQ